eukprot:g28328.t1
MKDICKNFIESEVSAGKVMPSCQDTGTAIAMVKRGTHVLTDGGGSANKTQLLQKTKGVLNDKAFTDFVTELVQGIGTAACPPYHLALVVGGLSAEQNLKTVKLASCKYLDGLPTSGNKLGRAFRDLEWEEQQLLKRV